MLRIVVFQLSYLMLLALLIPVERRLFGPATPLGPEGLTQAAAALCLLWCWARWIERRPLSSYGLALSRAWWQQAGVGFGIGLITACWPRLYCVLGERAHVVELWSEPPGAVDWFGSFAGGFFLVVANALSEELAFRAHPVKNLADRLGGRSSWPLLFFVLTLPAVWFAVVHVSDRSDFPYLLYLFLSAMGLASMYLATGHLGLPLGVHAGWNFGTAHVLAGESGGLAGRAVLFPMAPAPNATLSVPFWVTVVWYLMMILPGVLVLYWSTRRPASFSDGWCGLWRPSDQGTATSLRVKAGRGLLWCGGTIALVVTGLFFGGKVTIRDRAGGVTVFGRLERSPVRGTGWRMRLFGADYGLMRSTKEAEEKPKAKPGPVD